MLINHVTEDNHARASFRYRVLIPGKALPGDCVTNIRSEPDPEAINIYHKHRLQHKAMINRTGGIMDVTDDHFASRRTGMHYRFMCRAADVVTCCTEALADRILDETAVKARIIPDPYELPESPPKWSRDVDRWCWFGSQINLDTLRGAPLDGRVEIVTGGCRDMYPFPRSAFTEWSIQNLIEALDRSDFVPIPQHSTPKARAKSANRAVEAIRRGKLVIATRIPALDPLQRFVLFAGHRDEFVEAAKWARENVKEVEVMIANGQRYIADKYSPERIAGMWYEAFSEAQSRLRSKAD